MLGEVGRELRMVLPVITLDKRETRGKYGKGVGSWRQSAREGKEQSTCREGASCERTEHGPT